MSRSAEKRSFSSISNLNFLINSFYIQVMMFKQRDGHNNSRLIYDQLQPQTLDLLLKTLTNAPENDLFSLIWIIYHKYLFEKLPRKYMLTTTHFYFKHNVLFKNRPLTFISNYKIFFPKVLGYMKSIIFFSGIQKNSFSNFCHSFPCNKKL